MKTPFIIAEIGVNFFDTARVEGITPLEAAKRYIDKAIEAGADAVKFQSYKADTIVSKNSPAYWDLSKEPTITQYELFIKHDGLNKEDFQELCDYCKKRGTLFMSTPFDYYSVDYLDEMCDVYKISSSDINNLPFVRYIARKRKPIILSVGASYISEIEEAVRIMEEEGCPDICLLHCVLSYPCKDEDANLSVITTLKKTFPTVKIGYSDHTLPDESMTALTTAFLLGAEVIEKHFTLDKSLQGNDHYHAGDLEDFKRAVANFQKITTIIGQSKKTVLPCEEISRREARRSLVLTRDMLAGEQIEPQDVMAKRPGTGIEPKYAPLVIGRTMMKNVAEDTVLNWDMI